MKKHYVALLPLVALLTLANRCQPEERESLDEPPIGNDAMAPRMTELPDGGVILSWLESAGEGHVLAYSILRSGFWSPSKEVSSGRSLLANGADVPGVVQSGGGELFAHWLEALEGGEYAYGVQFARSNDRGHHWLGEGWLHDDTSPQEHGFVSSVALPDGVQAFWLDGRDMGAPDGATGLRTAVLGEGSGTPGSALLDERVCECCSTDAALGSSGPLVVYRDRSEDEIRDISLVRKTPLGWSEPISVHHDSWKINGCPVNGPAVAASGDRVVVAWFTAASKQAKVRVAVSNNGGESFDSPIEVDDFKPVGRVDIALGENGNVWVLWVAQGGVIRLRELSPGGETLSTRLVAQGASSRASGFPKLARQDANIVVAWRSESSIQIATYQ